VDACRLLSLMIDAALQGAEKSDVLCPKPPSDLCPEIAGLCAGNPAQALSPVASALEAAMNAFRDSESFADGSIKCMPHGPRALAAYGQLAGAWYGLENIPKAWRESLARNNLLIQMGNTLLEN
jgi:ADP-ribosyl-[dinitrogen reductase] hydrolase